MLRKIVIWAYTRLKRPRLHIHCLMPQFITDINYTKKFVMQFQLTVNNLLNTAYQSHLSRLQYFEYYTQSPNGHYGIYNMGRNICVKLIIPF